MKTLEQYFKDSAMVDHVVKARVSPDGQVSIEIHAFDPILSIIVVGDILFFDVEGNELKPYGESSWT